MDPDALLRDLLALANETIEHADTGIAGDAAHERALELAEKLYDLDAWIKRGGFLPAAWTKRCVKCAQAIAAPEIRGPERCATCADSSALVSATPDDSDDERAMTTRDWLVLGAEMRKAAKQARATGYPGVAEEYDAIAGKCEARHAALVQDRVVP